MILLISIKKYNKFQLKKENCKVNFKLVTNKLKYYNKNH